MRRNLFVRFGPERVRSAPISESAFVGAAVAAAMAGLRPVVEVMLVDFMAVAADALLNHAAKVSAFSGGTLGGAAGGARRRAAAATATAASTSRRCGAGWRTSPGSRWWSRRTRPMPAR